MLRRDSNTEMEEIGPVKTDWTVLTSEIKQTQQSAEEQKLPSSAWLDLNATGREVERTNQ